jgi:hypothetical protein
LISTFAREKGDLELTIVHADTPTLVNNLAGNDSAAQTAIYARLIRCRRADTSDESDMRLRGNPRRCDCAVCPRIELNYEFNVVP